METTMLDKKRLAPSLFGKVAVLLGGNSAEREVSLASGSEVLLALKQHGIDAHHFDPNEQHVEMLRDFDRVFIALHGRGGEDGVIQGALESLGIPYTGSGVTGSAISIDKILSKLIWHAIGLPTAKYVVVNKDTFIDSQAENILESLGGTVMIKPSLEGSSLGMAKASDTSTFIDAIKKAFNFDSRVLVETFIQGPEYTVSILNGSALPSISMKSATGFYDYHAKYHTNTTEYACPSGLSDTEEKQIQTLALEAFKAVKAEGWGRVDIMRSGTVDAKTNLPNGQFYLLENNTIPGMTNTSLVPKAAKQAGLSFTELVLAILQQTLPNNTAIEK